MKLLTRAALVVALLLQGPTDTLDKIDALLKELRAQLGPAPAVVLQVPSGADLNAVIAAAAPGTTLQLAVGGLYGPFTISKNDITVLGADVVGRATPAGRYPTVTGLDRLLMIPVGVSGSKVVGIEFAGAGGGADLIVSYGSRYLFDGDYIHGDPLLGQKRRIALNGTDGTVARSHIDTIMRQGQDTQAIGSCDGDGPFTIIDNYLEAAGENVMFGGCDPTVVDRVAADIRIEGNTLTKPLAWRTQKWQVKNLLELKNARRVVITRNDLSNSWKAAQDGYAIALTVRNQDGHCPWCTIEDVEISRNALAHSNGGINILGRDDEAGHPSGVMRNVAIIENTWSDINTSTFGTLDAPARAVLVQGGPENLSLERNTFSSAGARLMNAFLVLDQPQFKLVGLVLRGNTFDQGKYGIVGGGAGFGTAALEAYAPGYVFDANTVRRGATTQTIKYPAGTIFLP